MTDLPPSSCLADVLQLHDRRGWLSPPLAPLATGSGVVCGPAATIQLAAGGSGPGLVPLQAFLSSDLAGRVVVVAGGEGVADAVWGEILTLSARQQGAIAVAVSGRVRDLTALASLGVPVWGLAQATAGPYGRAHVVATDVPVVVGGVVVTPGDPVLVDDGGIVALPAPDADRLLADARTYSDAEDAVVEALRAGVPLAEAYRHKKAGVDRIRSLGAP